MTIEEKAQRIEEHCLSIESGCDGCELYDISPKDVKEKIDAED